MSIMTEVIDKKVLEEMNYQESYTCRYNRTKDKIFVKNLSIPSDIIDEIKNFILNKSESFIEDYDPETNNNEAVLTLDSSLLIQHQSIVKKFIEENEEINENNHSINIINEDLLPVSDNINFIIHKFIYPDTTQDNIILAFTKHERKSILNNVYKIFNGREFNKINKDDHYVFREDIVCFLYENNYYIYDKNGFHIIFRYWEKLQEIRDEVLAFFEESNIVSNLDDYRDTFNSHIYLQSMIKIDVEYAKDLINNYSGTIEDVCKEHELHLNFDSSLKQFEILDKSGVTNLNRILSKRSGYNLEEEFVTFPTYNSHQKR